MIVLLSMECRCCGANVDEPSQWRPRALCAACEKSTKWQVSTRRRSIMIDSAEMLSADDALRQVWFQLVKHTHLGHSPIDTLTRLLVKHFGKRFADEERAAPTLCGEELGARLELWSTQALGPLWRYHQRTMPGGPAPTVIMLNIPVVVLRLNALDCLIDGNNRINKRMADDVKEPHPVYLLERRA